MGRKSSVTQLPPEILDELHRILRDGRWTLDQIVAHLRQLGADVSRSAVHRYRQKYDASLERYRQAQEIAAVWVQKLGEEPKGDVGRLLAEMLKTVAFQTMAELGGDDAADPKEIALLARAIRDLEQSGRMALEREEKIRAAVAREMAGRLDAMAREPGGRRLDPETLRYVREQLYGG